MWLCVYVYIYLDENNDNNDNKNNNSICMYNLKDALCFYTSF